MTVQDELVQDLVSLKAEMETKDKKIENLGKWINGLSIALILSIVLTIIAVREWHETEQLAHFY